MDLAEIADILADYREAKDRQRVAREDMVRVAVEILGLPQEEAVKADLYALLDGYLIGQGMTKAYRQEPR